MNFATPSTALTLAVEEPVSGPGPVAAMVTLVVSPVSTLPNWSSMLRFAEARAVPAVPLVGWLVKTIFDAVVGEMLKLLDAKLLRVSELSEAFSV